MEAVRPAVTERSLTAKLNEPEVVPSLKVKFCVGPVKSTKMPPTSVVVTFPVINAANVVVFDPVIPVGRVKVTHRTNGELYAAGSPVSVNEPRLSTFGVPGPLPTPKKPADVVPLNVELV